MNQRVISGTIGGAILLSMVYLGGIPFTLVVALLVWLGIDEYAKMLECQGMRPQTQVMLLFSLLLLAGIYFVTNFPDIFHGNSLQHSERVLAMALLAAFVTIFSNELLRGTPEQGLVNVALNLFGTVYIGFMFAYMLLLRCIPGRDGLIYVFFTILVTWFNDTSAYFVGTKFGKHKLMPRISPKKSVEGALAGLLGGIGAAIAIGALCHKPLLTMGLLGAVVVLAGQFGDLIESIIKRNAGVKDSGSFLPGHGGILDRFDSLLMAAPVVYYMVIYIIPIIQ